MGSVSDRRGKDMSIILEGIDLPKKGERYHIFIEKEKIRCDKWSNINRSLMDERYMGEIEIKAKQIPKYHGKIVDLDDLVVKYWDGNYMEIDNEAYDNAVAILEAEGENDEHTD